MEREGGGREDGAADINLLTKGDWGHWIQSGLPAASQLFWPRYDRPAVNGFTVCNSNLISGYHAVSGRLILVFVVLILQFLYFFNV